MFDWLVEWWEDVVELAKFGHFQHGGTMEDWAWKEKFLNGQLSFEDTVIGIWGDIWDFIQNLANAIGQFLNLVIQTITIPFQLAGFFPSVIGIACLLFLVISAIKALRR